jgi:hypothetical protein
VPAGAAGLISGSQINAHSITATQIKLHSIHKADLASDALPKPGARGPQGPVGPQGNDGPQGPAGVDGTAGGFDPNKIQYVTGPSVVIPAGGTGIQLTATCPPGTKVISGGYFIDTGLTYWSVEDVTATAWIATIDNQGGPDGEGNAYAVCASP